MFYGKTSHNLDAKGRLNLPAKFRNKIESKIFLNISVTSEYLEITTLEAHNKRQEFFNTFNEFDDEANQLKMFINAYTYEVEIDKSGRINIPSEVMDQTGITKEVVVVGNGNKIAIWDAKAWDAKHTASKADVAKTIKDLAKQLSDKAYEHKK